MKNFWGMAIRRSQLIAAALVSAVLGRLLPKGSKGILIDLGSEQLLVPPRDVFVARSLGAIGGHDQHVLERSLAVTKEGSEILVVGAHVGAHAVPLARLRRCVTAIEANPRTYELLELNAAINATDLELHCVAAGSTNEVTSFWASDVNSGGSKVVRRRRFEYIFDRPTETDVRVICLDELLPGYCPDLVVLDIEGSEFEALSGMRSILSQTPTLLIEVCPAHVDDSNARDALPKLLAEYYSEFRILGSDDVYAIEDLVATVESKGGLFAATDVEILKPAK